MTTPNNSDTDGNSAETAGSPGSSGAPDDAWLQPSRAAIRAAVRVPGPHDDKYSRGVLGIVTGSVEYPGAAVLSVEAAARTGVGMIRFLGPDPIRPAVLQRRPEIVTAAGRVQAWLVGSGTSPNSRSHTETAALDRILGDGTPIVIDAGALDRIGGDDRPEFDGRLAVLTPHAGELATLLERVWASGRGQGHAAEAPNRMAIAADPARWAVVAAELFGATVVLKGFTTHVCDPAGSRFAITAESSWAATAGSGDVLAGIIAALMSGAGNSVGDAGRLAEIAAAGVWIHQRAVSVASDGGPVVALDIAEAVPRVVVELIA